MEFCNKNLFLIDHKVQAYLFFEQASAAEETGLTLTLTEAPKTGFVTSRPK